MKSLYFILFLFTISAFAEKKNVESLFNEWHGFSQDAFADLLKAETELQPKKANLKLEEYKEPIKLEQGLKLYELDPIFEKCKSPGFLERYPCDYLQQVIDCGFLIKTNPKNPLFEEKSGLCDNYYETLNWIKNRKTKSHIPRYIKEIADNPTTTNLAIVLQKFISLVIDLSTN